MLKQPLLQRLRFCFPLVCKLFNTFFVNIHRRFRLGYLFRPSLFLPPQLRLQELALGLRDRRGEADRDNVLGGEQGKERRALP